MLKLVILCLSVYLAAGFITVDDDVVNEGDKFLYDDCHSLFLTGYRTPGIYKLSDLDLVWCDFDRKGGYTVIVKRTTSSNFQKNMRAYSRGFGSFRRNYWWGLDRIHKNTYQKNNTGLRVEFTDWNDRMYKICYDYFVVESKPDYILRVRGFSGSKMVIDALSANNGHRFATIDKPPGNDCGEQTKAGWWFDTSDKEFCSKALPTGKYYTSGKYQKEGKYFNGMYWMTQKHGRDYSMKKLTMAIISPKQKDRC